MKINVFVFFLLVSFVVYSQRLIRCNDTTFFMTDYSDNFWCHLKLTGKKIETENKVIIYNGFVLLNILAEKKNYFSTGTGDKPVLSNYIINEMKYFSGVFKEKLKLMFVPVQLPDGREALIWHFDIPEKIKEQINTGETPAVKQVSVSVVTGDFIYSIGTTLFQDQSFEDLQKMLAELIRTITFGKGQLDSEKICE